MASTSSAPLDSDFEGVSIGGSGLSMEAAMEQAAQIASTLGVESPLSMSATPTALKAPGPPPPAKEPKAKGRGAKNKGKFRGDQGEKSQLQVTGPKTTSAPLTLGGFIQAGVAPPEAREPYLPPLEVAQSAEVQELSVRSGALSDTVSDLATTVSSLLAKTSALEQSNLALQTSYNKLAKEFSLLKMQMTGSTGITPTRPSGPAKLRRSAATASSAAAAKSTVVAPAAPLATRSEVVQSGAGIWGQEDPVE